ncbi:MAG: bifunctional transaldolase/phosoglucose isomerase [Bryobacteraceae bacterium]
MSPKTANPLKGLSAYGQSPWLDYIRRTLITSGELKRLIEEDGLRGITSNPAIFEKAITGSTDYQDLLESPDVATMTAKGLYEKIAIRDVQGVADILRTVYDATNGRDGYVSLEVSPALSHDTAGTIEEARRLWQAVSRPNLMVKVPATAEGIPAIQKLISEGININVTLLFSQAAYENVVEAYISGLEARAARGEKVSGIASVASFFISRIDTAVDAAIAAKLKSTGDADEQALLHSIEGKVAIANAKITYAKYEELFGGKRWRSLADQGAETQRLLWASTSSKNPKYSDVIYIDELIGKDTVNTIPPATFDAFRNHGSLRASVTEDVKGAAATMASLEKAGISMKAVTDKLLVEGLQQFVDAFDRLLAATAKRISEKTTTAKINGQSFKLPPDLTPAVDAAFNDWRAGNKAQALWRGDASLWTGEDEGKWLGWLGITDDQLSHIQHLIDVAADTKGFEHALLLGMGGSSLCPEVMRMTFGIIPGHPELHVLDSTDPAQVKAIEEKVDLKSTVCIVSSKSGGTLEPNIFKQYFFERMKEAVGEEEASKRFIAITDPGSNMQKVAERDKFRHIFYGLASIGGRYSALSNFGMVPAAIMGVDISKFLNEAEEMAQACGPTVPVEQNPGVLLGIVLGVAGKHGRDKVTIVPSPGIADLGAWLEQLLAESTGKIGKGLIPVDREHLGSPDVYANDRIFAYLRLASDPNAAQDAAVDALERAGHPVVRIAVDEIYDLGEEFFRWEIATATAGSILGINAFNQPDVEASKIATKKITSEYEKTGSLPPESPILTDGGVQLFTDPANASALEKAAGGDESLAGYLKAHLNRLGAGDYFAILGYLEMNETHEASLQGMRHAVRDKKRVATCLGFGPRFLHSTGQAYKGGPNSGVFLQITCDDAIDLPVPGQTFTFGVVKAAQARGDFEVLSERGRRALRVHIGPDVQAGLSTLAAAMATALA